MITGNLQTEKLEKNERKQMTPITISGHLTVLAIHLMVKVCLACITHLQTLHTGMFLQPNNRLNVTCLSRPLSVASPEAEETTTLNININNITNNACVIL